MRTRLPTSLTTPTQTLKRRRSETFHAALRIHGGSKTNPKPAMDGLFSTVQKKLKTSVLGDYVLSDNKVTNYVIDKCSKNKLATFENSEDNILRSISMYYTAGVMGKRKYQAVRLATSMKTSGINRGGKTSIKFMSNCPIPKLVTYNNLISEIKKIDIGKVYSVEEHYRDYIENENLNGCFREYLPRLATFYLDMQNSRKGALKWFGETEGTFLVALGGDGCPFGKNESACSFLASFLNVGKRVASSSDNFIIFGANIEKSSIIVKKYVQSLCKQIADLEGKVFEINGLHINFRFEELPNDMEMLAMLGGELSNSSTYFSSFANVSTKDCTDLMGTFGSDPQCKWKPWVFEERLKVVEKVESLKASLNGKPTSAKQKRSKVTEFIARQKSRQEFKPLVGKLIEKAHVEPLHLKNNAWGYFLKVLLKEAVAKSKLPTCKTFSEVPQGCCFSRVVTALKCEVKVGRLAKKVTKWFDETQGTKGDLPYRFTGKESRMFCQNYARLLTFLRQDGDSQKQNQTILALAYVGLRLRDCCSIINRFEIQEADLEKLKSLTEEYYRANALFLPTSVNPTIWTLGHVVHQHAKQVYNKYGQGLFTVTMV